MNWRKRLADNLIGLAYEFPKLGWRLLFLAVLIAGGVQGGTHPTPINATPSDNQGSNFSDSVAVRLVARAPSISDTINGVVTDTLVFSSPISKAFSDDGATFTDNADAAVIHRIDVDISDDSNTCTDSVVSALLITVPVPTWSDNFDGGTGYLENRPGWSLGTNHSYDAPGGSVQDGLLALANNEVQYQRVGTPESPYCLANVIPISADYAISIDIKLSDNTSSISYLSPVLRGSMDGLNRLVGYVLSIDRSDQKIKVKRINSGVTTPLSSLGNNDISDLDWTTYHTVKVAVQTSGSNVLFYIWIDGQFRVRYGDLSGTPITSAGNPGIVHFAANVGDSVSYDNFILTSPIVVFISDTVFQSEAVDYSLPSMGGGPTPINAAFSDAFSPEDSVSSLLPILVRARDDQGVSYADTITGGLRRQAAFVDQVIYQLNIVSGATPINVNISDSFTPTDTTSALLPCLATKLRDDQGVSYADSIYGGIRRHAAFWDQVDYQLNIVSGATPINVAISDDISIGLSDTLTALQRDLALASDTVPFGDSNTALMTVLGTLSDSNTPSDSVTALQPDLALVSDSLPFADSTNAISPVNAQPSDSTTQSDTVIALSPDLASATDTIPITDSQSALEPNFAQISDSLTDLADSVTAQKISVGILSFSFSDSFAPDDSLLARQPDIAVISDTQPPTDTIAALQVDKAVTSDSFVPTDTAAKLVPTSAIISDSFAPTDTLAARFRYYAQVSDDQSTNLSDSAVALQRDRALISDTFAPSDITTAVTPTFVSATDSVQLTDTVVAREPDLALASDAFAPSDTNTALQRDLAQLSDSFEPTDTVDATLTAAQFTPINVSISDSLDLQDILVWMETATAAPTDNYTGLADSVSAQLPCEAQPSDSFTPTDSVVANLKTNIIAVQISDSFEPSDSVGGLFKYRAGPGDAWQIDDTVRGGTASPGAGGNALVTRIIIGLNQAGDQGPSIGSM